MGEARARKLWSLSRLSLTPLPRQGSSRCLAPGTRFAALPSSPALRSGFGFSVQGSGFGDPTLGIRVQGPGIRDPGSDSRVPGTGIQYPVFGFQGPGFGFRVSDAFSAYFCVLGLRCRVSGSGIRDPGFEIRVSACLFRISAFGV